MLHADKIHALVLCWQWQFTMSLKVEPPDWPAGTDACSNSTSQVPSELHHGPIHGAAAAVDWFCLSAHHGIIKTYLQMFHSAPVIRSKGLFIKRGYIEGCAKFKRIRSLSRTRVLLRRSPDTSCSMNLCLLPQVS